MAEAKEDLVGSNACFNGRSTIGWREKGGAVPVLALVGRDQLGPGREGPTVRDSRETETKHALSYRKGSYLPFW